MNMEMNMEMSMEMNPTPPTCDELFDEVAVEIVQSTSDPSWRHGTYECAVYHRASDETYWMVSYRLSTDGEINELRDGQVVIARVYPHKVESIEYRPEPSK